MATRDDGEAQAIAVVLYESDCRSEAWVSRERAAKLEAMGRWGGSGVAWSVFALAGESGRDLPVLSGERMKPHEQ
jgi:hypothetical protein